MPLRVLSSPICYKDGGSGQRITGCRKRTQRCDCLPLQFREAQPCFCHTKNRYPCCLAGPDVLANAFADACRVSLGIEKIIRKLERDAQRRTESSERLTGRCWRAGQYRAGIHGEAD